MRFFDPKDEIGDSRNRDEPENIRDPCGMQYAKLERYSIALCMIRRIFLFGFWRPENVFSAGKQRVLRPAGLEIAEAIFFIQLTNGETCAF
jgi:hypothetical protein